MYLALGLLRPGGWWAGGRAGGVAGGRRQVGGTEMSTTTDARIHASERE